MDDITVRAIVIGVNILITIVIVSLVVLMFFQMQDIYGIVATTDNSIYSKFNDIYSMYDGKVSTGIGLLNTIKKYEDENETTILIVYPDSDKIQSYVSSLDIREAVYLKELMTADIAQSIHSDGGIHSFRYENKYNVSVEEAETGIISIAFSYID